MGTQAVPAVRERMTQLKRRRRKLRLATSTSLPR
jgi:hypothetical protein